MTDENARDFMLDLSFLEGGEHTARIYSDGVNAERYGSDYQFSATKITKDTQLKIELSKGGAGSELLKISNQIMLFLSNLFLY